MDTARLSFLCGLILYGKEKKSNRRHLVRKRKSNFGKLKHVLKTEILDLVVARVEPGIHVLEL